MNCNDYDELCPECGQAPFVDGWVCKKIGTKKLYFHCRHSRILHCTVSLESRNPFNFKFHKHCEHSFSYHCHLFSNTKFKNSYAQLYRNSPRAGLHPASATQLRDHSEIKMYGFCNVLLHQASVSTLASNLSVAWKCLCNPFGATSQSSHRRLAVAGCKWALRRKDAWTPSGDNRLNAIFVFLQCLDSKISRF